MKVSTITPTFMRPSYLDRMLFSLASQTRKPDEVVVVVKGKDEKTKDVIDKYRNLNIVEIDQSEGFLVQAYDLGIKSATGDLLLFIDDDAYAEKSWIEKYLNTFDKYKNLGGASGRVVTVKTDDLGRVIEEKVILLRPNRDTFWRRPLKILKEYCGGISVSGLNFKKPCHDQEATIPSVLLHGSNMAVLKRVIEDISLGELYRNSRKGLGFEMILGYHVVSKGFVTLRLLDPESPTVYHYYHKDSMTASSRWRDVFWKQYDIAKQYYRLKKLGADVSFFAYLAAMLVSFRNKPLPKILATLYAQIF